MSFPIDQFLRMAYRAASTNSPSRLMGHLADLRLPKRVLDRFIDEYVRFYGVRMDEVETPPGGYSCFNEFFTRRLRPGARAVCADPSVLVSPCDGRIQAQGIVQSGMVFQAKGMDYPLRTLLGDDRIADEFDGSRFVTIYLSPRDYHRVHFPADGAIVEARHIPGALYTVAPRALGLVPGLLAGNERLASIIQTSWGRMSLVMVGATGVGRTTVMFSDIVTNSARHFGLKTFNPGIQGRRGEEFGVFNLGSTVVLILPHGDWEDRLLDDGEPVKMGQVLFRRR